jgi:glyoxylase I family protein
MKAEILNAPREYPQYEPGYYAVFFLDPDGIKLEFVFTPVSNHSTAAV